MTYNDDPNSPFTRDRSGDPLEGFSHPHLQDSYALGSPAWVAAKATNDFFKSGERNAQSSQTTDSGIGSAPLPKGCLVFVAVVGIVLSAISYSFWAKWNPKVEVDSYVRKIVTIQLLATNNGERIYHPEKARFGLPVHKQFQNVYVETARYVKGTEIQDSKYANHAVAHKFIPGEPICAIATFVFQDDYWTSIAYKEDGGILLAWAHVAGPPRQ